MPAIIALAILVVGLNVVLFMTVDGHKRSMDARELQVNTRESKVAFAEMQRDELRTQISDLDERRRKALRDAEDAEKGSTDAQARKR